MPLLRTRRQFAKDLREGIRLLLPEDPGRDRMLETVRLFDTHARHVMGHRIAVDLLEDIHLTSPEAVDPEIAAEAGVPPGMTVAYFAQVTTHAAPADKRDIRQMRSYQAMLLVNGLAQRLGGVAWPTPDELSEPMFAIVFFFWSSSPDELTPIITRSAPDLMRAPDAWNSIDGRIWRAPNGWLEVKYRPPRVQAIEPPPSLGDEMYLHTTKLSALTFRIAQRADQVDPGMARELGRVALKVAQATKGKCTDLFTFLVREPEDLIIR